MRPENSEGLEKPLLVLRPIDSIQENGKPLARVRAASCEKVSDS